VVSRCGSVVAAASRRLLPAGRELTLRGKEPPTCGCDRPGWPFRGPRQWWYRRSVKRLAWLLAGLGVVVGVAWVVRSRRGVFGPPPGLTGLNGHALRERRSRSDPEALKALVDGSVSRVGLDLERLKELKSANYKPLMEYLG